MLKKVSMGHQNILTLVDYFETMNNCACLETLRSTPRDLVSRALADTIFI